MVFPEGQVELNNKEALYEKTKKILKEKPEVSDTNLFALDDMLSKTLKTYQEITS